MTEPFLGSFTVQDAAAAEALLDPRVTRLLGAFWEEARPVKEVATELGVSVDQVLYRVRRLEELGLLRQVGLRKRKGRPMRLYHAAAPVFFVPFEVTRYATLEAYVQAVEEDAAALVRRNVTLALRSVGEAWGLRVARGPDGEVHSKLALNAGADFTVTPDGPALLSFVYPSLHLDFSDAKALQSELLEVFARYAGRGGAQTYVCQIVLCPLSTPLT